MSEENVKTAQRWVELFNERGDVAEFLSLLDPEVELQTPGGPRLRGHDQARRGSLDQLRAAHVPGRDDRAHSRVLRRS